MNKHDAEQIAARAILVAEATEIAYMADDYGTRGMERIAAYLLTNGHSDHEAEAIMKSKHLRWADDSQGRGIGRTTTFAAFKRYYEANVAGGFDWIAEGKTLAAETISDLHSVGV